jgi:hypothetical protein
MAKAKRSAFVAPSSLSPYARGVRWFRALSFQRSALDALDDASSALAVALDGAPAHLVLAFVDGAYRKHAALLSRELEKRHRGALTIVVPVPSLGLPLPGIELPRIVLHAASAPSARFLPWRCDPSTNRLDFPLLPGPLGLLVFADAASLDVDRVIAELAARADGLAGLALHDVPAPWPLAVAGEVIEGGAVGVYCDDPTFAVAAVEPMATARGPAMIVTSGVAGSVQALDGRPALAVLEEWARALSPSDRDRLSMGLDVALDLRAQGVRSAENDLATCRMVALDRARGAFIVDAETRAFQALRFATRDDERAVATVVHAARDGEARDDAPPILLWPLEASPMAHWPASLEAMKATLAPWAVRGTIPLVGAKHGSLPVHRHAIGLLRLA